MAPPVMLNLFQHPGSNRLANGEPDPENKLGMRLGFGAPSRLPLNRRRFSATATVKEKNENK